MSVCLRFSSPLFLFALVALAAWADAAARPRVQSRRRTETKGGRSQRGRGSERHRRRSDSDFDSDTMKNSPKGNGSSQEAQQAQALPSNPPPNRPNAAAGANPPPPGETSAYRLSVAFHNGGLEAPATISFIVGTSKTFVVHKIFKRSVLAANARLPPAFHLSTDPSDWSFALRLQDERQVDGAATDETIGFPTPNVKHLKFHRKQAH